MTSKKKIITPIMSTIATLAVVGATMGTATAGTTLGARIGCEYYKYHGHHWYKVNAC